VANGDAARLVFGSCSDFRVDPLRLVIALAGIAAGLVGLTLDWVEIIPSVTTVSATNPVARSAVDAFVYFWSYFTHLTNLWLLLGYAAVLTGWRWLGGVARQVMLASAAAFITLVMVYYHFMLHPYYTFEGNLLIATYLLHYVAPITYLVWWTLCAPHGALRFQHLPVMILPGLVYVVLVLIRGAFVNEYPYDILDAGKFGYGTVAIGVLVLLVAVGLFSGLLVVVDRWLGRRSAAA
jgi:hypothetical protein